MNEALTQFYSCFGLLMLWVLWQYGWKGYAVDLLRQSLFPVRNRLFEMAARKEMGLNFNSPAYIALRQSLNARIRFAHRITFSHFWLSMLISKLLGIELKSFTPKVDIEIAAIADENLKNKLRQIQMERDLLFFRHMLLISPIFFLIVWISSLYSLVSISVNAANMGVKVAIQRAFAVARAKEMEMSNRVVSLQADNEDECPQRGLPVAV